MGKLAVSPTATDDEVRVLLERYRCPLPFHEVRARFLGNIATPIIGASPVKYGGKAVGRRFGRSR